jgi:transposase
MRPISAQQRDNILSLLASGYSSRDIANTTGVCKYKVSKLAKDYQPNKENLKGGHHKKLTPKDEWAIISLISTGRASTAVEAAKHINSIITDPVSTQTVRNTLQQDRFKSYVKKKKPYLSPKHRRPLLKNIETGL